MEGVLKGSSLSEVNALSSLAAKESDIHLLSREASRWHD